MSINNELVKALMDNDIHRFKKIIMDMRNLSKSFQNIVDDVYNSDINFDKFEEMAEKAFNLNEDDNDLPTIDSYEIK